MVACSGDATREHVGSTEQAWHGSSVHDDTDSLRANVVVSLSGTTPSPTGILITPTAVLTAAHCTGVPAPGDSYTIQVGQKISAFKQFASDRQNVPHLFTNNWDQSNDLAIVFLKDPVLEDAIISRPSLTAPVPESGNDGSGSHEYNAPPGGAIGLAGWARGINIPSPVRQAALFSRVSLLHSTAGGGQLWALKETDSAADDKGDSGGPLFVEYADGRRDPIGILHGNLVGDLQTVDFCSYLNGGNCDAWTDITRGAIADWVRAQMVDVNHGQHWLDMHPSIVAGQPRWRGEVDYTGPKDPVRDPDGDHWYTEHDNCPLVANVDQADANDDGIGDACAICPCDPNNDQDHDTVCGPSCTPGSPGCPERCGQDAGLTKVDNCPAVSNIGQANCNEYSEVTLQEAVLGDACDPVPCPLSSADEVTSAGDSCKGDNRVGFFCQGRHIHNLIHTTTIGSQPRNRDCAYDFCEAQPSLVVPQVKTQMRFCQQGVDGRGQRIFCGGRAVIRNDQANHFTSAAAEPLDAKFPWHRVSVSGLGPRTYPNDPDGAYHWNFGAPASDASQNTSHVWSFKTDESNWLRLG
jgi:hypothetical protein